MKNNGGKYTKIYSSMFGKSNDQQNNKSSITTTNNKSYLGVQSDIASGGSKSSRISTMYQKNIQKLKSAAAKGEYQSKSYNSKTVNRTSGCGFGNLSDRSKIIKKNINKSLRPSQPGGDNHHNISMQT